MTRTFAVSTAVLLLASVVVSPIAVTGTQHRTADGEVPRGALNHANSFSERAIASGIPNSEADATLSSTSTATTATNGTLALGEQGGWAEARGSGESVLDLDDETFTMEFWIKYNASSDPDARVLTKGNDYRVVLRGSGVNRTVRFNFPGFGIESRRGIRAGQWNHVALSVDGAVASLYVNGEVDVEQEWSGHPDPNDEPFLVGVDSSTTGHFLQGEVDDLRIWDRARTLSEIENNYLRELGGTASGLVALYQFDGGLSSSADGPDLSMNRDAHLTDIDAHPIPPFLYTRPHNGSVVLTWTERLGPGGQNEAEQFWIYRDGSRIATVSGDSYVDRVGTDSNGHSFTYRIRAVDSDTNAGDYSKATVETPYSQRGGGSLDLDGQGWAEAIDRPAFDLTDETFTMEFWIKYNASSDPDARVLTKGNDYRVVLRGSGVNRTVRFNFPGFGIESQRGIRAGQWNHVALSVDGAVASLYLNGVVDVEQEWSGHPDPNDEPLFIGVDSSRTDHHLNGSVDDVRFWSDARQSVEIRANYSHRLTGNEPGLKSYWRFNNIGSADETRSADLHHGAIQLRRDAKIQSGGAYPVAPYVFAQDRNQAASIFYTNRSSQMLDRFTLYVGQGTHPSTLTGTTVASSQPSIQRTELHNRVTYEFYLTSIVDGQESDFPRAATATPYGESGGASLSLDGESFAITSDRSALDIGDETFAMEFWIKYNASSDPDARVLTKGNDYRVILRESGDNRTVRFNFPGFGIESRRGIRAGQWNHVALSVDGAVASLYLNGEVDVEQEWSGHPDPNDEPFLVGVDSSRTDHHLAGQVDDIRIWRDTRDGQEVANNYQTELIGNEQGLAVYWRFNNRGGDSSRSNDINRLMIDPERGANIAPPGAFSPAPEPPTTGVTARLEPTEATVAPGTRTTLDVVVDGIDDGVGGYEFVINVSDTSHARIVNITDYTGGTSQQSLAPDGGGARLSASGGATDSTGPVTVATVTLEGVAPGSTDVPLTVTSLSDETGRQYGIGNSTGSTLTVGEGNGPPPVVGDARPTDPDGDGIYEDLNGDGDVTAGDATVLFNAVFDGNAAVMDNAARYDFNGDGSVTPGDATVLFAEVFEG